MPHPYVELSVFRTEGMPDPEIWNTGQTEVAAKSGKNLYGRGDLMAEAVRAAKLEAVASEPPPRHANITGWSAEKSEQKLKALQLAEAARLVLQ